MKYFVKFFVVTFFFLISTYALAEQKIAYIDMKYILNNSKAGKGAQTFLQKTFKKNQNKIQTLQKELKKEESDLLSKKTVLSKEDYAKESEKLRKKVSAFHAQRKSSLDKIAKQRNEARQALLKKLNPILESYMKEQGLSVIMDKKDIVLGIDELDITNIVVEKLNKELPSLNLK